MSVHCCLLQSTEPVFISTIARAYNLMLVYFNYQALFPAAWILLCILHEKSAIRSAMEDYCADLEHRETLSLQACLEWRLLRTSRNAQSASLFGVEATFSSAAIAT